MERLPSHLQSNQLCFANQFYQLPISFFGSLHLLSLIVTLLLLLAQSGLCLGGQSGKCIVDGRWWVLVTVDGRIYQMVDIPSHVHKVD